MTDLWETMRSRRSTHDLQDKEVPAEMVYKAIEYASLAPSAHNAQPWRFVWVRNPGLRQAWVTSMLRRYAKDMKEDGVTDHERRGRLHSSMVRFLGAPVLLLVCLTMREMDVYRDPFRAKCERDLALQSLGAAIENLLLALAGFGLASRWYSAPLFCPEIAKAVLELPADYEPQAIVTVGYGASANAGLKKRKRIQEILLER